MKQQTLALAAGFEKFGKQSRRAEFLAAMDRVVPWRELVGLIEPHYPNTGKDRPPIGVERMLRIIFFSSGSTCPILRSKTPCTSRLRCARLWASIFHPTDEDLSVGDPGPGPRAGAG